MSIIPYSPADVAFNKVPSHIFREINKHINNFSQLTTESIRVKVSDLPLNGYEEHMQEVLANIITVYTAKGWRILVLNRDTDITLSFNI